MGITREHAVERRYVAPKRGHRSWSLRRKGEPRQLRPCDDLVRDTGGKCDKFAMYGHTKCYQHLRGSYRITSGEVRYLLRYNLTGQLGSIYDKHLNDADFFDLKSEIALLRTVLNVGLQMLDKLQSDPQRFPLAIAQATIVVQSLVRDIGVLLKTCAELDGRLGYTVDLDAFKVVLDEMTKIVVEETTPEVATRVAERLSTLPWRRTGLASGENTLPALEVVG